MPGIKRKRSSRATRMGAQWVAAKRAATTAARAAVSAVKRPIMGLKRGYRGTVSTGRGPAPDRVYATLRYITTVASNGAITEYGYNANSGYSPNVGGGGHQPLGWDQWSTFYGRYRVDRVKVFIMIIGEADGIYSLHIDNTTSSYTTLQQVGEQKGTILASTAVNGPATATLSASYNLWQVTSASKANYRTDDRYQALVSANPTETIGIHFGFWQKDGSTILGNGAVNFTVRLDYDIEFFDLKSIGGS